MLASLLLIGRINSNDEVVQRLKAEYEKAEGNEEAQDSIQDLLTKRLIMLDTGEFDDSTPMNEDLGDKLASKLRKIGGSEYKTPATDFINSLKNKLDNDKVKNDGDKIKQFAIKLSNIDLMPQNEFDKFIKELSKAGYPKEEISKLKAKYKKAQKDNTKDIKDKMRS